MIRLRTPFLAAALFTGVAAVGLTPALAQTAPVPAAKETKPTDVPQGSAPVIPAVPARDSDSKPIDVPK